MSGWSAVGTAAALSSLAGVLAGFVFAGLVLLLQRRPGRTRIRAVSLFCAGFIVLGLASYLFGLVTGDNVETACKRVWTEVVVASGIFGVGAISVVSGIGWLLATYLGSEESEVDGTHGTAASKDLIYLSRLVRLMLYAITTITALLLTVTVLNYLNIWYDRSQPIWVFWIVVLYPVYILAGFLLFRLREGPKSRTNALFVGVFWSVIYATAGTLIDGFLVGTSNDFWVSPPTFVVIFATVIALVLPAPSLIALVCAVPHLPGTSGKSQDEARHAGLKQLAARPNTSIQAASPVDRSYRSEAARRLLDAAPIQVSDWSIMKGEIDLMHESSAE